MKKVFYFIILVLAFVFAYTYRENIVLLYNQYLVPIEDKVTKLEKNNYYRDYNFSYVKNIESFIPTNKADLINIYYTVVNSGMKEFTFYCSKEYTNCVDDVNDFANDQNMISNINNFVHPYNSFKTITTEVESTGKVSLSIDKVYDEEMIIILNYKVDEIIKKYIKDTDILKDKIKTIHDYIINNTTYDKDRSDKKIVKYKSDNAYGVLIENYGLCGGYTDAMMLFLEKFNVPNYKIATENHIWNYVKIDNNWLHLDLTWDDPITEDNKNILDDSYFLINDDELKNMEKEEHTYNADIFK